jgi:hypothetical protein
MAMLDEHSMIAVAMQIATAILLCEVLLKKLAGLLKEIRTETDALSVSRGPMVRILIGMAVGVVLAVISGRWLG